MTLSTRPGTDVTQSLAGKTGPLFNIKKPIANIGAIPDNFNIYTPCESGIDPATYKLASEQVQGAVRAEWLRGDLIGLAIAQVNNVEKLGELAQAEYDARASHERAEQRRQNWMAEQQSVRAFEYKTLEAQYRADESQWKAEAQRWKAEAARTDASTAGLSVNNALVGFQEAELALSFRKSKLQVQRDQYAADLNTLRQKVDDAQEKLEVHAAGATGRLGEVVEIPTLKDFQVPKVQFANFKTPSAADAINIPGVTRGMPKTA